MPKPSLIGKRIRFYRIRKGMTQRDLSDRTGIARSTIGALECGVKPSLKIEGLIKMADALGVTVDALVREGYINVKL